MSLYACTVDGSTFAFSSAQIGDARAVGPALVELSSSAAKNIGVDIGAGEPAQVPGMTPRAEARKFLLTGKHPNGGVLVEHVTVFARGTRVYQAFVVGQRPDAEAVQTFFSNIRLDA